MVEIQKKVVLAVSNSLCLAQVARFELRVEKDCLFVDVVDVEGLRRVCQLLWFEVWGHAAPSNRLAHEFPNMKFLWGRDR